MNYFALAQPCRASVCKAWRAPFSRSKQASHNAADGCSAGLPEGFVADWAQYKASGAPFSHSKQGMSNAVMHPIRHKRKGEIVRNRL
jgi:hypothetical protein